eukprot:COSAG01_NODE_73848_length_234_cov_115.022222_1_plen_54_part_10
MSGLIVVLMTYSTLPHSRELLDTPAGYGLVFPAYKMVGAPRPRSAPPGISHASA